MATIAKTDLRGLSGQALANEFLESDTLSTSLMALTWEEALLIANQIYIFTKDQMYDLRREYDFFQGRVMGNAIEKAVPLSCIQALLLMIASEGEH